MVNTRGTHKRRRLPAAVYLCYLLVAVLAFTGASVAGYKTESTGENSARVARFDIEAVGQNTTAFTLSPTNKSGNYSFTVTNNSETAVSYDVVVTVPNDQTMPSGVTVSLSNGVKPVSGRVDPTGRIYTFSNAGRFEAASTAPQSLTLTFTAGNANGNVSGISVDVVATQID